MIPPSIRRTGFTLIEISIVLIIVGLIIGGVLVGKDLIRASERRATLTQLEEFKTSVNVFKLKYNSLAGDMLASEAAAYGFLQASGVWGSSALGNNNGLLEGTFGGYENAIFWRHLSEAKLIKNNLGTLGNANVNSNGMYSGTLNKGEYEFAIPKAKLDSYYFLTVTDTFTSTEDGSTLIYSPARVYFILAGIGSIAFGGVGMNTSLRPSDLQYFDSKIDDGFPNMGSVRGSGTDALAASAGRCLYGHVNGFHTDIRYNITSSYADAPICRGLYFPLYK